MPVPADYTGDRELDTLLDLRARIGAAALLVKEARDAAVSVNGQQIAETVGQRVEGKIGQQTQRVIAQLNEAVQRAEQAARSAEHAAAGLSPRRALLIGLLGGLGGLVLGVGAGVYLALARRDQILQVMDFGIGAGVALAGVGAVLAVKR